jgi:SNF2 family DNA or RNA helicase
MGFDIGIFDEAHFIKNPKAHRTKACHKLKLKRAMVLTGSPMLNQANDLWGLLHRVDPAAFPRYWSFVNRYCVFGGYKDKQIVGPKNRTELNTIVQGVMIRRLKSDELDLPEKLYIPITVDFHPTQEKLYQQAEDELKIDIPDNPSPLEIENVLTKMLRLKQICGTPATIDGPDDSYKLDKAMEMLTELLADDEDSPPEHVVVFTQFRGVLKAMQDRLDAANADPKVNFDAPTYTLHGDVPMADRQNVVRAWESGRPGVMLAMIQVAGVGLNMTAARTAIFLDKLWTPKLNEQAEDRLHRIGADKSRGPVQIYSIMVKKSVEQRVEAILRSKTKTFNDVVEESDWKKRLFAELQDDESADTD